MPPRLFYDPECPVCRSFAKLLRTNLHGQVELVPMDKATARSATEFSLELPDGSHLQGEPAIKALEKMVPAIGNYFWMLPPGYRGQAVIQSYRFGKWLRRLFGCRACGDKD